MLSFTYTRSQTQYAANKYKQTDCRVFEAITKNDHMAIIGLAIDLFDNVNGEISVGSYKGVRSNEHNTPLSYALMLLQSKRISAYVVEALIHVGANANDDRVLALICAPGESSDPSWLRAQKLICDDVAGHILPSILDSTRKAFDHAQDNKWDAFTSLVMSKPLFLNYSRKRKTILDIAQSSFGVKHFLSEKLRDMGALTYAELEPKIELVNRNNSLLPMYYARRKNGYEALPTLQKSEPMPTRNKPQF